MIGTQVKDYRIIQEIGKGGMASVFLVEHTMLHNQAALKLLNQEYVRNEHIRKRFLAEARSMARMSHTGVVKVTDLIEENDTVAFVMEYIEGETLKEYLDRKVKLKDDEIKTIFSQMLEAVGYVHEQNLVHRDIKPSNFMIDKKGKVKLMDFGIAKTLDASSSEYTQTGTGMQMGTPMYMSPEQITETKSVTAQSDIYSLGVVLWQMVSGQKPYDTKTLSSFQLQTKIVNEALAQTNSMWDGVIQKCTQKDIGRRFIKCADIAQAMNLGSVKADTSDSTVVESNGASVNQEKPRRDISLKERMQQERERKRGDDSQGSSKIKWVLIIGSVVLFSALGYHFFAGSGSSKVAGLKEEKTFKEVKIGDQIWMAENLNVSIFRNGDPIPEAKTAAEWKMAGENKQPAWCYYDNNPANGEIYGKLYNWYAVNDPRGLAPRGWHVSSDEEWTELTEYLGGDEKAGVKMKSKNGWYGGGNGTNSSGFTGLPGGFRYGDDGTFYLVVGSGNWWSSSENTTDNALYWSLAYDYDDVSWFSYDKGYGYSVRCLRD